MREHQRVAFVCPTKSGALLRPPTDTHMSTSSVCIHNSAPARASSAPLSRTQVPRSIKVQKWVHYAGHYGILAHGLMKRPWCHLRALSAAVSPYLAPFHLLAGQTQPPLTLCAGWSWWFRRPHHPLAPAPMPQPMLSPLAVQLPTAAAVASCIVPSYVDYVPTIARLSRNDGSPLPPDLARRGPQSRPFCWNFCTEFRTESAVNCFMTSCR